MKLALSRGGAAIAVCAAALLTLSACSGDSSDNADSSSSAAPSSTAEAVAADLDARAEDLMLADSDFPPGGEYIIMDKAAIDADEDSEPEVTPATCSAIAEMDEGTEAFDRAKVEYSLEDGSTIETEVVLGQNGSLEQVASDIEACPAMTLRGPTDSGAELVAEMENSVEDVEGSTVPAKTIVSTGTATVGADSVPITIRSTGAYVDGTTVSVQITLTGDTAGNWNNADDAFVVELLNKQIAKVQEAAAA
ncbi:hypothetical protein [Williamsia soli]|uniref:hypothetical protein n=1 Tax=Williamsia soli TaxID=364929 RepID=UPI001A9CFA1D|nr:hypothetical protein [Williamsia soli]